MCVSFCYLDARKMTFHPFFFIKSLRFNFCILVDLTSFYRVRHIIVFLDTVQASSLPTSPLSTLFYVVHPLKYQTMTIPELRDEMSTFPISSRTKTQSELRQSRFFPFGTTAIFIYLPSSRILSIFLPLMHLVFMALPRPALIRKFEKEYNPLRKPAN